MNREFLERRALELWQEAQDIQIQGDVEKAIELYSKSISVYPTAEAYTFRGWAYGFLKRFDDAIEDCMMAISIDPEFGNPYNDIGSYLVSMGKFEEAVDWLEKAKEAPRYEPRHFPYMNLGRIYALQGMILKAIREFELALKISPHEPTCTAALTYLRSLLN